MSIYQIIKCSFFRLIFRLYCNYIQCSPMLLHFHTYPFSLVCPTDLFFIFFQWMLSILLDMLSMWSTITPFIGIFNKYLSPGNIRSKASIFSYTCHIVYRRVMFDYSFNSSLWSYSFSTLSLLLCIWTQCLIFF